MKTTQNINLLLEKQVYTSQSEIKKVAQEVRTKMEEEKIFTRCGLTVRDLASEIGAKPYLVSKAINQIHNKSFVTLINEYRVKEVIRLMNSSKDQTHCPLGLAFESGFNSKTSFNIQFKRITGLTPKEYKTLHPLK